MKFFCVLSDERAWRSKSPAMHNSVLRRRGIDGVYVPFMVEADQLVDAVRGLKALNIAGANVTVPYKEKIMEHLDDCSDEARTIGAVNTIVPRGSRFIGENTDARGFMAALASLNYDPEGKTALVFGTGGAARAIVFALGKMGFELVLLTGRNPAKARRLARLLNVLDVESDSLYMCDDVPVDLVVNATTASGSDEEPGLATLVEEMRVVGCDLVVDINYGREQNMWQEFAVSRGARFMDGLPMLANQACLSFALWTGLEVPADEFLQALTENP